MNSKLSDEDARRMAKEIYAEPSDDNIEIDDDAPTSEPGEPERGKWVQAWVFVENPDYVRTQLR